LKAIINLFNKLIIAHRQQRGLALISPSTTVHSYIFPFLNYVPFLSLS